MIIDISIIIWTLSLADALPFVGAWVMTLFVMGGAKDILHILLRRRREVFWRRTARHAMQRPVHANPEELQHYSIATPIAPCTPKMGTNHLELEQ